MKVFPHFFILVCLSLFSSLAYPYANETATTTWQPEGFKPNYFILGDPNAKLSLSFKIKLIEKADLYLAYSQLMFWEVAKESSPFEDVNYNPEIFYRLYEGDSRKTWADIGIYEHESNGRDMEYSRGWNRFYLLYSMEAFDVDAAKLYISFKGWVPYDVEDTNEDITEYRGLYEINFTLAQFLGASFDQSDLILRIYSGGNAGIDPTNGGQELTLRLRGEITKEFLPVLTFQLFNGYGESLLNYNQRETEFRVGIGF